MIPSEFSIVELLLIFCLLGIVPIVGVATGLLVRQRNSTNQIPSALRPMLLLMLAMPLVVGLLRQNDLFDMVRDVLPFMFFLLPVFMYKKLHSNPDTWIALMCNGYSFVGLAMSVRHFAQSGASFSDIGEQSIFGTGISLAFDPAVQFAFPYLLGMSLIKLIDRSFVSAASHFILSLIPMFALLGVVARAPLVLSICSVGLMLFIGFKSKLFGGIMLGIFVLMIAFSLSGESVISKAIELMLLKHENYGINGRDLEFSVVMQNAATLNKLIFGQGWGGLIANPLGDGALWRYVHNMLLYFFFKQVLIGLAAVIFYSYWLIRIFIRNLIKLIGRGDPRIVALLSLIPPMFGSFLLEVTFKTMMFGLLLCLLVAISASLKKQGT